MPKIIRWFKVTHDINADPEMWELRERFGDRAGYIWLECLSIASRNEGHLGVNSSELHAVLASHCRVYSPKVRGILEWCLAKGWLEDRDGLYVTKWLKYNGSREDKKIPHGKPETPLQTRLEETRLEVKNKTPPSAAFALPDWIKQETWESFKEMRRKERHPLTDKACQLVVRELEKLAAAGHDPNECLERSILSGWRGVFAPNGDRVATKADLVTMKTRALFAREFKP